MDDSHTATDALLLELMLDEFHLIDNAWTATFCVGCSKEGLRAALLAQLDKS